MEKFQQSWVSTVLVMEDPLKEACCQNDTNGEQEGEVPAGFPCTSLGLMFLLGSSAELRSSPSPRRAPGLLRELKSAPSSYVLSPGSWCRFNRFQHRLFSLPALWSPASAAGFPVQTFFLPIIGALTSWYRLTGDIALGHCHCWRKIIHSFVNKDSLTTFTGLFGSPVWM